MQIIPENLTKNETERLVNWLHDPGSDIFIRLLESEAFKLECESAKHLAIGTDKGVEAAKAGMKAGEVVREAVKQIRKFKQQTEFKTYRAIP